jgi:hypothetical protein
MDIGAEASSIYFRDPTPTVELGEPEVQDDTLALAIIPLHGPAESEAASDLMSHRERTPTPVELGPENDGASDMDIDDVCRIGSEKFIPSQNGSKNYHCVFRLMIPSWRRYMTTTDNPWSRLDEARVRLRPRVGTQESRALRSRHCWRASTSYRTSARRRTIASPSSSQKRSSRGRRSRRCLRARLCHRRHSPGPRFPRKSVSVMGNGV